jgi:hypothetical protein
MPHAPTLTNPTANIVSARYYDKKGMSRFCTFDKKFVYAVGTDPSGTPTVDKRSFQPLLVANGSACPDPAIGGHKEGAIVYTCTWPNGSTIKKTVIEIMVAPLKFNSWVKTLRQNLQKRSELMLLRMLPSMATSAPQVAFAILLLSPWRGAMARRLALLSLTMIYIR